VEIQHFSNTLQSVDPVNGKADINIYAYGSDIHENTLSLSCYCQLITFTILHILSSVPNYVKYYGVGVQPVIPTINVNMFYIPPVTTCSNMVKGVYMLNKQYTINMWDSAGIAPCMSGLNASAILPSQRKPKLPFQLPCHLTNSLVTTLTELSWITT
jgi:hypothetical protein